MHKLFHTFDHLYIIISLYFFQSYCMFSEMGGETWGRIILSIKRLLQHKSKLYHSCIPSFAPCTFPNDS